MEMALPTSTIEAFEGMTVKDARIPSEKVVGTTELIEHVLFYLPIQDLLVAQRVCKSWRQIIGQSSSLQSALFQKLPDLPTQITPVGAKGKKIKIGAATMTILNDSIPGRDATDAVDVLGKRGSPAAFPPGTAYNPFFSKFISAYGNGSGPDDEEDFEKYVLSYDMSNPIFELGSSYRSMQIAQPSIQTLIVVPYAGNNACQLAEQRVELWSAICYDGVLVENPTGLTFGDLFGVTKMIAKRHKNTLRAEYENGDIFFQDYYVDSEDIDECSLQFYIEVKKEGATTEMGVSLGD